MKRFFMVCILAGLSYIGTGQTFNIYTIEIRDTSGVLYPPDTWHPMVNSGRYTLTLLPGNTAGIIRKLPEEAYNRRIASMPKPAESKFFTTGDKIGTIAVSDIDGKKFGPKELAGKVLVLNFWFINCPPCRLEIPDLNETVKEYQNNPDVVFIAVALDQQSDLKNFLKTTPYRYHIIDNGGSIASKYGVSSYPTHVVVDKEGKVSFHTSGLAMNTVSWLKRSIDAALIGTMVK